MERNSNLKPCQEKLLLFEKPTGNNHIANNQKEIPLHVVSFIFTDSLNI
jgi:hypothetical protein